VVLSAEELHRRGLACSNTGRYTSARLLYRRALQRAAEPETVARIKLSLAYVEAELGSTDQGLALCAEALTEPGIGALVRGLIESQLALLHVRAGAGQQALASFATAINLLGESPEALARAYLNRGLVYLQRGNAEGAEADAVRAGQLYRQVGDTVAAAKADHNLGCAKLLAGDLVSALRLMEQAAPLIENLSATYQAVLAQDRAEVLVAAGMLADAELAFETAVRAYGSRRLRQRQAEVELILARTVGWQDPRRAALLARRAERRFRQRGSEAWALRAEAVGLTADLEWRPPSATRVARAAELAALLRRHGLPHDATMMTLSAARGELACGDAPAAGRRLATVRPGAAAPLGVRLREREIRAEVAAATGRRRAALGHVRRGLDELHRWQSTFGSLDLHSTLVGHGRRLATEGLRLALADGRPEVVFEWSERARALGSRVIAVRPTSDPTAARALAELRQTTDEAAASTLRARIRQQSWYGEGSHQVPEPATLDAVAEALGAAGGVLASYVAVDDDLCCLVVDRFTRDVVRLGRVRPVAQLLAGMQADLDMAAARMAAEMRGVVLAGLRARVEQLADMLVRPLTGRLSSERVLVVPPGVLAGTPWSMLPGLAGRAVTVPRSASRWLAGRGRQLPAERVGLVAGPGVPRADEEVTNAGSAWPRAEVVRAPEAQAAMVSDLAARVDVLHVAAHGRHSADNPLFSGLELADGPWFGYDIDQLSSIPDTVILSACELGRSSVRWGAETIGMSVAWLHAGARTVVASPASVADDVACEVLTATHARLAEGAPAAEALADAARTVDDAGLSPFLCFGSGW
jgi:tetratricopeptide (TPR) repeat protein